MEDFIVEGNAPTVPGSIAILRSISVDHKGGGLGTGLPFESVDPKNWWGLPTARGEDCLEVMEVKVSVRPKVPTVLSVLPALGHVKPIGGPEGQLLAVEGQGGDAQDGLQASCGGGPHGVGQGHQGLPLH